MSVSWKRSPLCGPRSASIIRACPASCSSPLRHRGASSTCSATSPLCAGARAKRKETTFTKSWLSPNTSTEKSRRSSARSFTKPRTRSTLNATSLIAPAASITTSVSRKRPRSSVSLEVEQVPHYGFAKTAMTEKTIANYAVEISNLGDALVHRRKPIIITKPAPPKDGSRDEPDDERNNTDDAPASRHLKAVCRCNPPFIIRVSRRTLSETRIVCEKCGEGFGIR